MLSLTNGKIAFDFSKCQQCGTCLAVCPTHSIHALQLKNGLTDIKINQDTCIQCKKCIKSCPSTMKDNTEQYNESFPAKKYYFSNNADKQIRYSSSSGGTCKTLIIQALKQGLVDGVYTLGKSNEYPYVKGTFYTAEHCPSFQDIPNSVYHSVMLNKNVNCVPKCKRLMVVGTNCQLKALEIVLKHKCENLIKVCIFCKQQKCFDSTRFLAKIMGAEILLDKPFAFQYRGNGWPGTVRLNGKELPYARASILPFGKRLWTVPGCNICGDSFSQYHADLSLMDPWGEINPSDTQGTTLVTVHTQAGNDIIKTVKNLNLLEKSYKEVIPALGLNDINRKQKLIPYFLGENCSLKIKTAAHMEILQRKAFTILLTALPKMPILFYRIIHKSPDLRNLILR